MATPGTTADETSTGAMAAGRLVVVLLFTGIETAALAVWLAFVLDAPTLSQMAAIGLGVLVVGLVVEHVLTGLAVTDRLSFPGLRVVFISVTETVLWAGWLLVAEQVGGLTGVAVAGAALFVLLVPQHTVEDNVLRGDGLFSDVLAVGTVGFSFIEAAGATVWLALVLHGDRFAATLAPITGGVVEPATVGLGVLAVALFVEHVLGVRFSRRAG